MDLKHLDTQGLQTRLITNFACSYSQDDRIFILTEAGVYVLAIKCNITSSFPTFSHQKSFFKVNTYDISANVGVDINQFTYELPRNMFYEVVLRQELSTNLHHSSPVEAFPMQAEWSQEGIVGGYACLLGVLSNINTLEVFSRVVQGQFTDYVPIANLTKASLDEEAKNWEKIQGKGAYNQFEVLVKRVESIAVTSFCWGHVFERNKVKSTTVFTGHMNGTIKLWRLNEVPVNCKEPVQVDFLGQFPTNLSAICSMAWYRNEFAGGILTFGDKKGRVNILHVASLDKETAEFSNEKPLWEDCDDVKVDKLILADLDEFSVILVVKQSYLILFGVDFNGMVFERIICNVGHLYITGVDVCGNVILIQTLTGVLKQLTLSIQKDKLHIVDEQLEARVDNKYRMHGFFFTKNRVILGMLGYPKQAYVTATGKQHTKLILLADTNKKPLDILLKNNTKSIGNFWDCFETLRITSLQTKTFPWQGLDPNTNYDTLPLTQLKTLRVIAKSSEEVFNIVSKITSYDIKPYVLLHYLVDIRLVIERLNRLINKLNHGIELTLFQMQSIDLQVLFLKEMILRDILAKANVGEKFIDDLFHIIQICNELQYPDLPQCLWCGEKILGLTCIPPHADSRCVISFMPITILPGFKCPICKCLAHKEIEREFELVLCPYCDVIMDVIYEEEFSEESLYENKPLNEIGFGLNMGRIVKSCCPKDCLGDASDEEVPNNSLDFIIFSDSEEESEAKTLEQKRLKELYESLDSMSLQEVVEANDVKD